MRMASRIIFLLFISSTIAVGQQQTVQIVPQKGPDTPALAQPDVVSITSSNPQISGTINNMAVNVMNLYIAGRANPELQIGLNMTGPLDAAILAQSPTYASDLQHNFRAAVATTQTKKQIGSSSSTSGSTSLTQKAGIEELLGIAIENGAVDEDVSGTVLTLRTSAYGIIAALSKEGDTDQNYSDNSFFSRIGGFASFNVTNSNDPLQDATRKQLSNAGASFRLFGDTSPRSQAVQKKFIQFRASVAKLAEARAALSQAWVNSDVANAIDTYTRDAQNDVKAYLATSPVATAPATQAKVASLISAAFDRDFVPMLTKAKAAPGGLVKDYIDASTEFTAQLALFQAGVAQIVNAPVGSLTYTNQQQTGASSYSNVLFAYSGHVAKSADITSNLSSSLYSSPDKSINQQTFRDAAFALSIEWKSQKRSPFLSDSSDKSPITASFSGRYQRLQENDHVAGKKADIGEGNLKIEIPFGSGLSFPLSMTFANAGQSVKETYVRGNFGITFDLEKLASLLGK